MKSIFSYAITKLSNARNWPLGFLVSIGLLGGCFWAVAELTDEVLEGETQSFDERVLMSMRSSGDLSDPVGPPALEEVGRDLTALGGVTILTLLIVAVSSYLVLTRRLRTAILVVVATGSGIVVSSLLKIGFDRPRPDLVAHHSHVATSSFPSGHSMMAAICYLTLAALLASVEKSRRVKLFLLSTAVFLTMLVGLSRVYMGVHWPTDVVAGWLMGAIWAIGSLLVADLLQKRGQIEEEA
ncbi:MAG: phosphatase PAP2 family protein [Verrucomicrobiales bacterium]|nr:phosphatase PAP2 family protein [Verrucomicrobiales bacterium]